MTMFSLGRPRARPNASMPDLMAMASSPVSMSQSSIRTLRHAGGFRQRIGGVGRIVLRDALPRRGGEIVFLLVGEDNLGAGLEVEIDAALEHDGRRQPFAGGDPYPAAAGGDAGVDGFLQGVHIERRSTGDGTVIEDGNRAIGKHGPLKLGHGEWRDDRADGRFGGGQGDPQGEE